MGLIAAPSYAQRFESVGSSAARLLLQPVNPGQLLGVASKRPSLFADPGIHRADPLPQFVLHRRVSDAPAGALQRHFDHRSFRARRSLNPVDLQGSASRQTHELGLAQRFMQFALRLVFFPQPRSIDVGKPRPFLVPLCFPPLLVLESAKKSGVRCWRPWGVRRVVQLAGSISRRVRSQTYAASDIPTPDFL